MNEIITQAAEVAKEALGALRTSPLILALVIVQFMTIGAAVYLAINRENALAQSQSELHRLLDKCIGA